MKEQETNYDGGGGGDNLDQMIYITHMAASKVVYGSSGGGTKGQICFASCCCCASRDADDEDAFMVVVCFEYGVVLRLGVNACTVVIDEVSDRNIADQRNSCTTTAAPTKLLPACFIYFRRRNCSSYLVSNYQYSRQFSSLSPLDTGYIFFPLLIIFVKTASVTNRIRARIGVFSAREKNKPHAHTHKPISTQQTSPSSFLEVLK